MAALGLRRERERALTSGENCIYGGVSTNTSSQPRSTHTGKLLWNWKRCVLYNNSTCVILIGCAFPDMAENQRNPFFVECLWWFVQRQGRRTINVQEEAREGKGRREEEGAFVSWLCGFAWPIGIHTRTAAAPVGPSRLSLSMLLLSSQSGIPQPPKGNNPPTD